VTVGGVVPVAVEILAVAVAGVVRPAVADSTVALLHPRPRR
jgi:hypothetical protein